MCHKCGALAWLTRAEYCRGSMRLTNIGKETASRWYCTIHLAEEIIHKMLCQKPDHKQRGILTEMLQHNQIIYIFLWWFFFFYIVTCLLRSTEPKQSKTNVWMRVCFCFFLISVLILQYQRKWAEIGFDYGKRWSCRFAATTGSSAARRGTSFWRAEWASLYEQVTWWSV